ncbi:LpxD N-terminal domain-containing protein, partial [Prosthecobacter sp.]
MSSSISLQKLAELVGGELITGPGEEAITGIDSIIDAGPGDATFLGNVRYLSALKTTRASVALVPEDLDVSDVPPKLALIRVKNPTLAFSSVIRVFGPPASEFVPGVHATASVASDVVFDPQKVSIGPHAVIEEGVKIGDGTTIHAGVSIGRGV